MYLVCGEALYDVFLDSENETGVLRLEAHPGGSPYNVAIGIARLGGQAALLTGMSHDMLGQRLFDILTREGVATDHLVRLGRRTTVSLVGVDAQGHPAYTFYGLGSADCSVTPDDIQPPGPDITGLHFGSFSLVVKPVADAFAQLVEQAGDRFVSVDPNVRTNVEPDVDLWRDRLTHYASRADLIKISAEDSGILFPGQNFEALAADWISGGCRLVIVTDGGDDVLAWTASGASARVTPDRFPVIDTVGAGDSFQAALLAKLAKDGNGDPKSAVASMDAASLSNLLGYAISAARVTCGRRGADLPRAADLQ